MHRPPRIILLAALLLISALWLLRHQRTDPGLSASPDQADSTSPADSGPPVEASPHEDEVMVEAEPAPAAFFLAELTLAALQQARDQGVPVKLPVPFPQMGQVERVNSYAADQVSATGTLAGTLLRFRLNRLGQTTSLALQDAQTGRFQTWLSQGDAPPVLLPAPEGEDLKLNCDVLEPEPARASAAGGVGPDFRGVHPRVVDGAAHAPFLAQSQNLARATATPVVDVAVGWYPAALEGLIPDVLRSLGRNPTRAAAREFLLVELYADFDYANECLENSAVDLHFNPLLVSELPAAEYIDNGTGGEFVGALRDPADGKMDDFLREATAAGADIFTAVVGGGLGIGGIAYLNGRHSIASVRNTVYGNSTYMHEWGHNMGCQHTRAEVQNGSQPWVYDPDAYSYAWTFEELGPPPFNHTVQESWSTLMGSGTEDNTLPYFSNPDSRYVHPTSGTSHILGNAENDNRRVVRENFRRLVNHNTVPVAPTITSQPAAVTIEVGEAARFSVGATGTALTYQWKKDGNDITSATAGTYEIASAVLNDAGDYTVVVSNPTGSVTSAAATLTVTAKVTAPEITSQPASIAVEEGDAASFSVGATGTAPLTYQWRKDGSAIAGATAATYAIASAALDDAGDYTVVVSNSASSVTSQAATLTVTAAVVAPAITTQPVAVTVQAGAAASFSVVASGTTPLTYQWRQDGNNLPGATAATYRIASVNSADAGDYTVVVSNSASNVTSNAATLTVTAATTAPAITSQPASRTVDEGDAVSFSVGATGTAPLTYQWRRNATAIAGATAATYAIASVNSADAGNYTVVVSNAAGNAASQAATLTVTAAATAPAITSHPASRTVDEGDAVSFTVGVTGTAPLTYQWRRNGSAIAGATSATYRIASAGQAHAGNYTAVVSNSAGDVTSNAATLTVTAAATAPAITRQTTAVTVDEGEPATFSILATGTAPLTYQWRKDGTNISGATTATYRIASAGQTHAGDYTVVVSNSAGSATSTAATLTVTAAVIAPAFQAQPAAVIIDDGAAASFNVTATGTAPLTYQWRKNGSNISGATSATYRIASAGLADAGAYSVVVSNSAGSVTSNAATLTVNAVAPRITSQPVARDVVVGDVASFSVIATGTAPLTYRWRRNGTDLPGATNATFRITRAALNDAGDYTVVVTNSAGNVTSSAATLTVTAAVEAPAITTQPTDMTVEVGAAATFSVVATGTAPLTYQWRRNGTNLPGASSATYRIARAALNDAGDYTVVVTNSEGNVTSSAATLTVNAVAPRITTQPAAIDVVVGDAASFSVGATGTAPLTYQWRQDGNAISGATAATHAITSAILTDAGDYTVVVTNSAGNVTSAAATLTVTAAVVAPAITAQPTSRTVDEGDTVSFGVGATGTAPLTYQWRKDGTNLSGSNSSTYAIAGAGLDDAGAYSVVVSNSAGRAASSTATLTVTEAIFAPAITTPPLAVTVVVGGAANFSVGATGTAPLAYQWRKEGIAIAGANNATYRIIRAALGDAGDYSVVVSNAAGSVTSPVATLSVSQVAIAPAITTQPMPLSVGVGATANFSVDVAGTSPFTWQWRKDGRDIANATAATYVIAGTGLTDAGDYSVVVTNSAGSVTSSAASLTVTESSVLSNISVRTPLREAQVLVMGAVVSGGSKRLLIRAAGPALEAIAGLDGLPDPQITLYDSQSMPAVIGENDDWDNALADTFVAAGAFPFLPNSKDSAYLLEEASGSFTVHVSGKDGEGIVLVEAYDRSAASGARLTNVSARNFAGTGNDTFIAGFVISGTASSRVLIRVIGPTLGEPPYSVPGILADPVLTVFDRAGEPILSNDDWDAGLAAIFESVGAFPLLANSKDAALVDKLAPGEYTVQVLGANGGVGEALIEVYEVRAP